MQKGGHGRGRGTPSVPATPGNIVLCTASEADRLFQQGQAAFGSEIQSTVNQILGKLGDDW